MGCGREEDSNRAPAVKLPLTPYEALHTRHGKPGHPAASGSPSRILISRPPPGPGPVSKSCSTELGEEEGTIPKYNPHPGE